jgi:hypothetical protein
MEQLISSINVKDLDKIKSSPSQQSVDGIDETFRYAPRKTISLSTLLPIRNIINSFSSLKNN